MAFPSPARFRPKREHLLGQRRGQPWRGRHEVQPQVPTVGGASPPVGQSALQPTHGQPSRGPTQRLAKFRPVRRRRQRHSPPSRHLTPDVQPRHITPSHIGQVDLPSCGPRSRADMHTPTPKRANANRRAHTGRISPHPIPARHTGRRRGVSKPSAVPPQTRTSSRPTQRSALARSTRGAAASANRWGCKPARRSVRPAANSRSTKPGAYTKVSQVPSCSASPSAPLAT